MKRKWSNIEVLLLKKLYSRGETLDHISIITKRSIISIKNKLNQLNLITKPVKSNENDLNTILNEVSDYTDIPKEIILLKTRKREIVQTRQMCQSLACNLTKLSTTVIGGFFGGKDHATVLHACKTVTILIEVDPFFAKIYDDLLKICKKKVNKQKKINKHEEELFKIKQIKKELTSIDSKIMFNEFINENKKGNS